MAIEDGCRLDLKSYLVSCMVVTTQMCLQVPSRVLNSYIALKRVQAKFKYFWCAVRAGEQELKAHARAHTRQ